MTNGVQKTVIVLGGPTGPTGTFKGVNILSVFTGATGEFAQWLQATGATGPNGTFESIYNIGPTGLTGQHKNVIISGYSGGGGGGAVTTFNPLDKDANMTLSNGNLTATNNGSGNSNVRGTTSKTTGKWYFEFSNIANINSGNYACLGFATPSLVLNSANFTGTAGVANNGNLPPSGATNLGSAPNGHNIGCCIDIPNALAWFRYDGGLWNNSGTANPATGIGGCNIAGSAGAGTWFPMAGLAAGAAETVTINCGQLAFAYAPPSGFTKWG